MKMAFTKRKLDTLSIPDKDKIYYYDDKTRGLALRVTKTGVKTFVFYRWLNHKPERITIGRYPDLSIELARGKASEFNALIAQGGNPAEQSRQHKEEYTLRASFEAYIERHGKLHNKTWQEEIKNFERYLSRWQHRKLSSITRDEVQRLHIRLGNENGKTTANRTLELLRVIYNKVITWELYEGKNPASSIERFKLPSRDRFLQEDELKRFFEALKTEENETARDFFLMCLFTGARKSNVLAMAWNDIDFNNCTWRISETKNGKPHVVPLVPAAVRVLNERYRLSKSVYVFPGRDEGHHLVNPNKVWRRILKRADIQDLRIHDLRRTMGSYQAKTGTSLPIIGKSLAHQDVKTTSVYARLDDKPVRDSMIKATQYMEDLAGNVFN